MICDPDDIVGVCGICETGIMAGEEVNHDDIENPLHYRCLQKAALEEMARISQETRQYDYNSDNGGD